MNDNIILCDLTYTQQTIASDVFPAAVAGIGNTAASSQPTSLIVPEEDLPSLM